MAHSAELRQTFRDIAALAIAKFEQEGQLNVRQGEQLRRALASAAEELGWNELALGTDEPVREIRKIVLRLTRNGAKAIAKDLEGELAVKKKETKELAKFAASLHKMAASSKTEYPLMLQYDYTARDASKNLVTRTEELELNEASEVTSAAEGMERSTPSRQKLTDAKIVEIKATQARVAEVTKGLPEFTATLDTLIEEVLATLV